MPSRISRRRFVKSMAAATAAAPLIVPASALGRDGRAAPSERITVAMIGCGKMANDFHLSTLLKMEDVQMVAVCEVDRTRREHAKNRVETQYGGKPSFSGCDVTDDFREVAARDDIDAVCIATPDHWHAIPIIEACQAKKDVYCEKPLTLTILEAKRCIEAVNKYERVFQTGSQQRSSTFGQFRLACELIRSGRIGDVKTITVGVGGPSKPCDLPEEELEPGLNWDMWLGQAPLRPYNSVLSPRGVHNHFPAWRAYREYPAEGTPTWALTITTSPNGLWTWTIRGPWKSFRPTIHQRDRALCFATPTESKWSTAVRRAACLLVLKASCTSVAVC